LLFVSSDGQFTTFEGTFTYIGKDKTISSVPVVAILEFKEGKNIHEALYHDGRKFF
jgi:hypothetical protein